MSVMSREREERKCHGAASDPLRSLLLECSGGRVISVALAASQKGFKICLGEVFF